MTIWQFTIHDNTTMCHVKQYEIWRGDNMTDSNGMKPQKPTGNIRSQGCLDSVASLGGAITWEAVNIMKLLMYGYSHECTYKSLGELYGLQT